MSLSDGDAADGGDVWFRVITQQRHLVRGRVHHSALKGNAIGVPDAKDNRSWARELSGRLRSMAGNLQQIEDDAVLYCAEMSLPGQGTKEFSGVIYIRVRDAIASCENLTSSSVHYTPLATDTAHADVTFLGWPSSAEEHEKIVLWLTDLFQALHHPGQLQHLPAAETR